MIYGYLRTTLATADGKARIQTETRLLALANVGLEPGNIFQNVAISGCAPVSDCHWEERK